MELVQLFLSPYQIIRNGCKVSSFECEVEGIILGVNMAIEHLRVSVPRTAVEEVYFFVIVRMQ